MFTGIVERLGVVTSLSISGGSARLQVDAGKAWSPAPVLGESIAVNGVCLTVTSVRTSRVTFDLLAETLEKTNLGTLSRGAAVNLERALRLGDGLSGHLVTGHVDGTGVLERISRRGQDWVLRIKAARGLTDAMVPKGSVTLDGISLTLVDVTRGGFTIHIIPHTWAVTNLSNRHVGDAVNIENDLIGKYVERFLNARDARRQRFAKR